MTSSHDFGGRWTDKKLELVKKYLQAYTIIFHRNPKAQKLHTIYLDAFAGTGYRNYPPTPEDNLLIELNEEEAQTFLKGSARIALEIEPPFKEFIFIENDPEYARELEKLRKEFLHIRPNIHVHKEKADTYLPTWIKHTNWRSTRAVIFLDPYGMQVDWNIIELIGRTQVRADRSADLRKQAKRVCHEPVTGENRMRLAKDPVVRGKAPPEIVIVHRRQIVVDQRERMDAFDRDRRRPGRRVAPAADFARREDQYRPKPLPAGRQRVLYGVDEPRVPRSRAFQPIQVR